MVVPPEVVDTASVVVDVSNVVASVLLVASTPVTVVVVLPLVVVGVEAADDEDTPSDPPLVVLAPVLVPGSLPGGTGAQAMTGNRTSERGSTRATLAGSRRT
jgi:hypothetical protein